MVGKFGEFPQVNWSGFLYLRREDTTAFFFPVNICSYFYAQSDLQYEVHVRFMGQSCHCSCFPPLLCSAPGATDHCGDLLHDEEVQVQANDPDPGEAVQV